MGKKSASSKGKRLTKEEIRELERSIKGGHLSQKELSERFNISTRQVRRYVLSVEQKSGISQKMKKAGKKQLTATEKATAGIEGITAEVVSISLMKGLAVINETIERLKNDKSMSEERRVIAITKLQETNLETLKTLGFLSPTEGTTMDNKTMSLIYERTVLKIEQSYSNKKKEKSNAELLDELEEEANAIIQQ